MFKKWRPSKQLIGALIALIVIVAIAFSFGYLSEMLAPKVVPNQTQKQYDAPKMELDFQSKEETPKELKVSFSEERQQQDFNKQTSLSFEKKIVDSKENERNFLGMLISGILIVTLISGIAVAMYIQWRNAKRNNEIGGM